MNIYSSYPWLSPTFAFVSLEVNISFATGVLVKSSCRRTPTAEDHGARAFPLSSISPKSSFGEPQTAAQIFFSAGKARVQSRRDVVHRLQTSEFERSRRLQVRLQTTKIRILRIRFVLEATWRFFLWARAAAICAQFGAWFDDFGLRKIRWILEGR